MAKTSPKARFRKAKTAVAKSMKKSGITRADRTVGKAMGKRMERLAKQGDVIASQAIVGRKIGKKAVNRQVSNAGGEW